MPDTLPLPEPGASVRTDELTALRADLERELPRFLDDLAALVAIDSGSYDKAGVDEVGRWVGRFLERLGARIAIHPDPQLGDTLVATFEGRVGGGRSLVIGHTDTVFPLGTAAERPFRIEDGQARGPGVSDMKGGLLAGLYAIRALRTLAEAAGDEAAWPFERLVFVANPDEEIGSPVSTPVIREQATDVDACFVLEAARANGDIVSSRKGILDARLTIHGRAAHAGVEPHKGRNAIVEAAHQALALTDLNGRWPGVTANVGVVGGGTRPNVVPERAILEVDLRAVSRPELEAAEAELRRLAASPTVPDVRIEFEEMSRWWPMERLESSERLVAHARALADRLAFATDDTATGGASDANTTAGMGIPSLDGLGPIGGDDHSTSEWLAVDSIVPRTTLFAALLLAVARDPAFLGGAARVAG
ncbi:MAG: M20 family metallopeptidase [Candidatus Limnocylindrales bacterium]